MRTVVAAIVATACIAVPAASGAVRAGPAGTGTADLRISSVDGASLQAGSSTSVGITITNDGPDTAQLVVDFLFAAPVKADWGEGDCESHVRVMTCTLSALSAGGSVHAGATFASLPSGISSLRVRFRVRSQWQGAQDPNLANNGGSVNLEPWDGLNRPARRIVKANLSSTSIIVGRPLPLIAYVLTQSTPVMFTICSEFSDSEFGVTCDKRLVSMNDFTNKPTAPGVHSISLAELLRHDEYGTPTAKQQPLAPGTYLLLLGWSGGGGVYTDWTFKLNVN